jgi:hypothetical protein
MVQTIAFLSGLLCIVAAILDWDWFFDNWRASLFVNLFGRGGARIVYVILGLILIGVGSWLASVRPGSAPGQALSIQSMGNQNPPDFASLFPAGAVLLP